MCENWSKNDAKLPLGGFLGASGGPLGALWVSRCVPRLESSFAGRPFGDHFGAHFWSFFAILRTLGPVFLGSCFDTTVEPNFHGFKVNFG